MFRHALPPSPAPNFQHRQSVLQGCIGISARALPSADSQDDSPPVRDLFSAASFIPRRVDPSTYFALPFIFLFFFSHSTFFKPVKHWESLIFFTSLRTKFISGFPYSDSIQFFEGHKRNRGVTRKCNYSVMIVTNKNYPKSHFLIAFRNNQQINWFVLKIIICECNIQS